MQVIIISSFIVLVSSRPDPCGGSWGMESPCMAMDLDYQAWYDSLPIVYDDIVLPATTESSELGAVLE